MTDLLEKTIAKDDDIVKSGGELIFNPYNEKNKEITLSEVQTILNNYGVVGTVNNIELYKRAFVHCSYTKRPALENQAENITIVERPYDCIPLKSKSNERLEFLGDGVLECYTKYYLYRRFPKEDEGFMTEKKIALVKNEHIGKLARDMGLHKWYLISKHAEEKNIRTNTKKLGCLFEAFLGALFLDFNKIQIKDEDKWFESVFITGPGFQMAQLFLESIFEKHVDWTELISNDDNYKNQLQVLLQKEFKKTPDYMIISQDLEEGYTMGVYLCLGQHIYDLDHNTSEPFEKYKTFKNISDKIEKDNKIFIFFEKGTHKIKKKAEQIACEKALNLILNKT
jgi:dsRNA-specific ribonuclease